MIIGDALRAAREARGETLEEAEKATRIRARWLAALETGEYASLPSETQARGFLRLYAEHLGLNPAPLLHELGHGPRLARLPRPAAAPAPMRPRRRLFSADLLVAAALTLALGLLLVWGAPRLIQGPAAEAGTASPAPSPSPALTPTATSPAAAEATSPPLPTPRATYLGVNVLIRAELRAWVSVRVDGAEVFAGQLAPGEAREFAGQSVIELATGNGRGTRAIWNGVDQGTLGDLGEVVIRLWTLQGPVTPTPTAVPTEAG